MSANYSGFVVAGAQLGLLLKLTKPQKGIKDVFIQGAESSVPSNYEIIPQIVVEERFRDELQITSHPVQSGAQITDHAFKIPTEVTVTLGWSNSPTPDSLFAGAAVGALGAVGGAGTNVARAFGAYQGIKGLQSAMSGAALTQINARYEELLQLQQTRALFTLYTTRKAYRNMVAKTVATMTNAENVNAIEIQMVCQQLILVDTVVRQLDKDQMQFPDQTDSPTPTGELKPTLLN